MKDIKYYVLWKEKSPLLSEYLDKYYTLLIDRLNSLLELKWYELVKDFLLKDNKDLVLNSEISSLINFLFYEEIKDIKSWKKIKEHKDRLIKEISLFLNGWFENTEVSRWDKIKGTNIILSEKDYNPYNTFEAHPDHKNNGWTIWFWEKSKKDWLKIYEKSFSLLKKVDKEIFWELNLMINKVVPLWTAYEVHNSASYRECIWNLYMWYTLGSSVPEINNLEALIHESSHNKLNLVMHFDPIILNAKIEEYYSPYRPDARHIHWAFLWLHAFVPTMYILLKSYTDTDLFDDEIILEKIILYILKNKVCLKVLRKHWRFSQIWLDILDETEYVMNITDEIIKKMSVSKSLIINANKKLKEHFWEVNKNYPYLKY